MSPDLQSQTDEYRCFIEDYLDRECFQYDSEPQKTLFSAMRYSLLAGGKRLRPILVFDFCRMCGGNWKSAATFAAAVEMIHPDKAPAAQHTVTPRPAPALTPMILGDASLLERTFCRTAPETDNPAPARRQAIVRGRRT